MPRTLEDLTLVKSRHSSAFNTHSFQYIKCTILLPFTIMMLLLVIPQPPTLTGPLSITVGTPGTWTSVSAGGNPASTLKMTIDGVYVTNGFSTQVTPIGNTFSTSGTLNWTPTNSDVGLREFCVEAYHDLLNPYQKICKQVRVEGEKIHVQMYIG